MVACCTMCCASWPNRPDRHKPGSGKHDWRAGPGTAPARLRITAAPQRSSRLAGQQSCATRQPGALPPLLFQKPGGLAPIILFQMQGGFAPSGPAAHSPPAYFRQDEGGRRASASSARNYLVGEQHPGRPPLEGPKRGCAKARGAAPPPGRRRADHRRHQRPEGRAARAPTGRVGFDAPPARRLSRIRIFTSRSTRRQPPCRA